MSDGLYTRTFYNAALKGLSRDQAHRVATNVCHKMAVVGTKARTQKDEDDAAINRAVAIAADAYDFDNRPHGATDWADKYSRAGRQAAGEVHSYMGTRQGDGTSEEYAGMMDRLSKPLQEILKEYQLGTAEYGRQKEKEKRRIVEGLRAGGIDPEDYAEFEHLLPDEKSLNDDERDYVEAVRGHKMAVREDLLTDIKFDAEHKLSAAGGLRPKSDFSSEADYAQHINDLMKEYSADLFERIPSVMAQEARYQGDPEALEEDVDDTLNAAFLVFEDARDYETGYDRQKERYPYPETGEWGEEEKAIRGHKRMGDFGSAMGSSGNENYGTSRVESLPTRQNGDKYGRERHNLNPIDGQGQTGGGGQDDVDMKSLIGLLRNRPALLGEKMAVDKRTLNQALRTARQQLINDERATEGTDNKFPTEIHAINAETAGLQQINRQLRYAGSSFRDTMEAYLAQIRPELIGVVKSPTDAELDAHLEQYGEEIPGYERHDAYTDDELSDTKAIDDEALSSALEAAGDERNHLGGYAELDYLFDGTAHPDHSDTQDAFNILMGPSLGNSDEDFPSPAEYRRLSDASRQRLIDRGQLTQDGRRIGDKAIDKMALKRGIATQRWIRQDYEPGGHSHQHGLDDPDAPPEVLDQISRYVGEQELLDNTEEPELDDEDARNEYWRRVGGG